MRLRCALLLVAGALLLPGASAAPAQGFEPSCKAVTKAARGAYDVSFRLKCNFSVELIAIDTSRDVTAIRRRARAWQPDPGEKVRCARRSRRKARCSGGGARGAIGAFAVEGSPCAGLRTKFDVSGGADCPPTFACPDIGYAGTVRVRRPRGC